MEILQHYIQDLRIQEHRFSSTAQTHWDARYRVPLQFYFK